jgi:hypothetical protein
MTAPARDRKGFRIPRQVDRGLTRRQNFHRFARLRQREMPGQRPATERRADWAAVLVRQNGGVSVGDPATNQADEEMVNGDQTETKALF